jgi:hypothetical protein
LDKDARVCDLIDPNTGWWNIQLVHSTFTPEEAERICGVALCSPNFEDTLIWSSTPTGIFSVKSAYHIEHKRKMQAKGESSQSRGESEVWKRIWQLKAPAPVKNFCWRLCNNLLLTKENLFLRKIAPDPLCMFCLQEPETSYHILWGCPSSMAVWQECSKKIQKLAIGKVGGKEFVQFLWEKLEDADLLEALMVARAIWMRRNQFLFQRGFDPPSKVVVLARKSVEDFLLAISHSLEADSFRQPEIAVWKKPPAGTTKINWDAAFNLSNKRMGIGVVARDSLGRVVAAKAKVFPYIADPATGEALGARLAVSLGCELGFTDVILEGDSLVVIGALKKHDVCLSSYGHLIDDAKQGLLRMQPFLINHVRREANWVAHCLAKLAISQLLDAMWVAECPSIIHHVISAEH